MRKFRKLWKVYASSKKIVFMLVIVGIFLGCIPNVAQLFFISSENEVVESAKQSFGIYGVRIGEIEEADEATLEAYKNVKKWYRVKDIPKVLEKGYIILIME